jgi:outer membrane protein assembly factor BamB
MSLFESMRYRNVNLGFIALSALLSSASGIAADWSTFAHDPERTGWANEEKTFSPTNVSTLGVLWKVKLDNQFYSLSALTPPIVATNVPTAAGIRSIVYVAGSGGSVFALDEESGEQLWSKSFRSMTTPRKGGFQGTFLCPNGITATPVIDRETNLIYVVAADGSLYGLELGSGQVKYGPVQFIAPFAKSWSLNIVDGTVYTTVSLGCGNGRSGVYAAEIRDPRHPVVREVLLSGAYTAGIWGRGGAVIGKNGKIYGGTADGDTDPKSGDFSNTVVAVSKQKLSVVDYFLPPNWAYLKKVDLDVGSASPVWFTWRNRNLLAHGFKQGLVYLMDADDLGGTDHRTPLFTSARLGNDKEACCDGSGIWGSLSTSRDDDDRTWLYVPMGGPPSANAPRFPITNGDNPHGSIMAFKVTAEPKTGNPELEPAWISGDFSLPDPAVIANGVLFALSTGENADQRGDESRRFTDTHQAILKALDAKTGKELYSSGSEIATWVHFSGLAVANGRIYVVDHDSNLYSFGLTKRIPVSQSGSRIPARGDDELSTSWIGRAERQDELRSGWIARAGITLFLALVAATIGLVTGMKRGRSST